MVDIDRHILAIADGVSRSNRGGEAARVTWLHAGDSRLFHATDYHELYDLTPPQHDIVNPIHLAMRLVVITIVFRMCEHV